MKNWGAAIGAIAVLIIAGVVVTVYRGKSGGPAGNPTPTPNAVAQLPAEMQPEVEMAFSPDAHYVTVNIANLHADHLEYNLIYDATVKSQKINTGVNDSQSVSDQDSYSKRQLLGSESSGKFTYHENIQNAFMELTLRDEDNRSIFTATYPFEVEAGKTVSLSASE